MQSRQEMAVLPWKRIPLRTVPPRWRNTFILGPDSGIVWPIPARTAEISRSRPCKEHSRKPGNAGGSPGVWIAGMIASNTNPFKPLQAAGEEM